MIIKASVAVPDAPYGAAACGTRPRKWKEPGTLVSAHFRLSMSLQ